MPLTDKDVGRFIQKLRVERGMTQATLASRVRMPRSAISRLENGYRAVTVPELVDFAGALSVAIGSIAISSDQSELKPSAERTARGRPEEVEHSRSQSTPVLGWRQGTLVGIYDLISPLATRASRVGLQRLRNTSKHLIGTVRALILGSVNAAATVFLIAAVWAGLLAVWFTLFGLMLNGHHQSANAGLGQGEVTWVLVAILLGASLTGCAAHVLSLSIRGLIGHLVAYAQPQQESTTRSEPQLWAYKGPRRPTGVVRLVDLPDPVWQFREPFDPHARVRTLVQEPLVT